MKKFKILILFLFIIFQSMLNKTYTYETFNNRYSYGDLKNKNEININNNIDEEILFIMDFSGSMNKKMGYTPKSFLAIDAIRDILDEVGASTKIGLRIFGITDRQVVERYGNKLVLNKEAMCTASNLVLPIARYNNSNISNKLSKYLPRGATPIGYSLRQAVQNDFSPNAKLKHIILVTDGNENCGDDPCLYIKNLMQLRDDYKVDVIGITLEKNAFSQLKCISNAGKGNYYSVNSPNDFKVKFTQALHSTQPKKNDVPPVKNDVQPVKIHTSPPIYDTNKYKNYVFEFQN